MQTHALRSTTSLLARFDETRDEQTRQAFIEAVASEPETTMAELAHYVQQHPELRSMTLDELLMQVRRRITTPEDRLAASLATHVGPSGFAKIYPGAGWPEIHVSAEALHRVGDHKRIIAEAVVQVLGAADRLGIQVMGVTIYPETVMPGDVGISFAIGAVERREELWKLIVQIEPTLPFMLWLRLS